MSILCPSMIFTTLPEDGLKRGRPYDNEIRTQRQTRCTRGSRSLIQIRPRSVIILCPNLTSIQNVHEAESQNGLFGGLNVGFSLQIYQMISHPIFHGLYV